MEFFRTDDRHFNNLKGYDFKPHYLWVDDEEGGQLRVHYLDEGAKSSDDLVNQETLLLMHGEPSWSYLYRKMINKFVEQGYRVIAPDLVGFGRSDKPSKRTDYTFQRHVNWMTSLFKQLEISNVTLVCQDWGGLIGLRLVAENSECFSRVVTANTMLPTGDQDPGPAFRKWQQYSQQVPEFNAGNIIKGGTTTDLAEDVIAAYNAPFPEEKYKEGARQFPLLVPITPDDPAATKNRQAWEVLKNWHKPFLTAFSDSDPISAGGDTIFQKLVPGTKNQPHTVIINGGHFLQEDQGEALADAVIHFIQVN